jgi:multiple antibiotic resistance protein
MIDSAYVATIFFLLLGPIKIIPAFASITSNTDAHFRRELAITGTLVATVICAIVVLGARTFVAKYQVGLDAVRITGGLILLISALNAIFPRPESAAPAGESRSALQLALSPLASPVIVTPAGIAAIIVFELLAAQIPCGDRTIITSLAVVMALNFLVMFFNGAIMKIPGLGLALQLLGTVLVVVQAALAVQVLLISLEALGLLGRSQTIMPTSD